MRRKGWLAVSWCVWSVLVGAHACGGRTSDLTAVNNDSESHFLASCQAGGCPEGLSCLLGVCTQSCGADAECTAWSPSAVCRPEASGGSSACDVECNAPADCVGLGTDFRCASGVCRANDGPTASEFLGACINSSCSEGLSCVYGQCTRRCQENADCGSTGAICDLAYGDAEVEGRFCVLPCGREAPLTPECASFGARSRCLGGACREVFGGQCGDLGQPGAEWACYDAIAADVMRERHASLLDDEVCLPARDGQIYDVDYRLCAETACAGGASGCAVTGLVLETQPTVDAVDDQSSVNPVVTAQGEVRLREPLNVRIELLGPVERCEYSVGVRYWGLQFFDGYTYLSARNAAFWSSPPEYPLDISGDAIESGLWQAVRDVSLRHQGSYSEGVTIEDSEAQIELLSGGERCTLLQELIGVRVRSDLVNVINARLRTWARGVEDTLECRPCGIANCELACRYR